MLLGDQHQQTTISRARQKSNPKHRQWSGQAANNHKTRKQSKVKNKPRQEQGNANKENRSEMSANSGTRLRHESVFVCRLNSPPDRQQGCMQSVPRHGVLWVMESVKQWQRSRMECPLEELMGTPAGDCDTHI